MPKCKLLCTKNINFNDGTYLRVATACVNSRCYKIVFCTDPSSFSAEILRGLLLSREGENVAASAAVATDGNTVLTRAAFLDTASNAVLDLSLAVAVVIFASRDFAPRS